MKKLFMMMSFLLFSGMCLQAQEVKKVEEKKVVVVTKKTDENGKITEERIEASGADADKLLKELKESGEMEDIDIEIIMKEGKNIKKKKTSSIVSISKDAKNEKTVEVKVTGNDDDSRTIVIRTNDPETGETVERMWNVVGDEYPEDLKKIMEEENILIDQDEKSKSIKINMDKDGGENGKVIFRINKDGMDEGKVMEWISEGGEFPIDLNELMEKEKIDLKFSEGKDGELHTIIVESDEDDLPEVNVRMGVRVLGKGDVIVAEVEGGSSAEKAGLKEADMITEIDDYSITSYKSLMERLANYKAGDKIKVRFIRDGKANTTSLQLAGRE